MGEQGLANLESEYQLLLARDLGYLQPKDHQKLDNQVNEIKRMLRSFICTLSEKPTPTAKC